LTVKVWSGAGSTSGDTFDSSLSWTVAVKSKVFVLRFFSLWQAQYCS